jgi:putative SOS response-associated peptidase YedK
MDVFLGCSGPRIVPGRAPAGLDLGKVAGMCGRYILSAPPEAIADHFDVREVPPFAPSWNIAPTRVVPVIRETAQGERECVLLRWGLVPVWAKDPAIGSRMINARAESCADKPAYRAAFRKRRCIVPVTGFYEWKPAGRYKQPYLVRLRDAPLFGLGGLWEHWHAPEGDEVQTFTIVTTAASAAIAPYHDRMPLVIARGDYEEWLSSPNPGELLRPFAGADFEICPVSRRVNSVENDDASLAAPIAAEAP